MRTIKFRAWDKRDGTMKEAPAWDLGTMLDPVCGFEVMQFTGFLDKNGKEIYEGDILGYWGYETKWVVGWNPVKCCYSAVYTKEDVEGDKELQDLPGRPAFSLSATALKGKQIIGNIYENTELLTTPTTETN